MKTLAVRFTICLAFLALSVPSLVARDLSFEDRVVAQRAIEEVYWLHRIWPEQNHRAKPALSEVLSESAIRARVSHYLELSDALAKQPGRAITPQQLKDEMSRMVAQSRAPGVLQELFAALGDDPFVIEETLVRQRLVEGLGGPSDSSKGTAGVLLSSAGAALTAGPEGSPIGATASACGAAEGWSPTSTGPGVPQGRESHTAVWTGSEMIVWGGIALTDSTYYLNSGGRYEPATDTWTPVSTTDVPEPRSLHTAVWTGTEMIVWGGISPAGSFQTGGRYNPATETWTPTSLIGVPEARNVHTAVWTGTEMIVWGGFTTTGRTATGGRYHPVTDAWTPTSTASAPEARGWHTAVWASGLMIVWGGQASPPTVLTNTGGRYNPSTDTWLSTATAGAPLGRSNHTAVGTGLDMIIWGGYAGALTATGGRYDPSMDVWVPTATVDAPQARSYHTAVWTGTEMIVWGGFLDTGGKYAPVSDGWAPTTTNGAPSGYFNHTAVWAGTEMIVWGGQYSGAFVNTGGRYCSGCDDGNPCTADTFDAASGCVHTPTPGVACDDGRACTIQDACDDTGSCAGQPLAPGSACDDGNACTANDVCNDALLCVGGTTVNCDDANACTIDTCDSTSGCRHTFSCNDNNSCTDDSCDPAIGCFHTNNTASCSDGIACTTSDRCNGGVCQGTPQSTYCPNDWCRTGSCVPAVGCVYTPRPDGSYCEDNDRCAAPDQCVGGGCRPGPRLNCDDGEVCTVDWCSNFTGCRHDFVSCDDQNACTEDRCRIGFGCVHDPNWWRCDDSNMCTDDLCEPPAGNCSHPPKTGVPCNDNNECTTDNTCSSGGACVGGSPRNCDDGNICTNDFCDPILGCIHSNNTAPCSDGNACTTNDVCSDRLCTGEPSLDCNDWNACTQDWCDSASGCNHTPLDCNDWNLCTDEPCDTSVGCVQPVSNHTCDASPQGLGYWKRLCEGPVQGEQLTSFDVDCVNNSCTFAPVASVADICDRLNANPPRDRCEQGEAELMALQLNACRLRVADTQPADAKKCTIQDTVGGIRTEADSLLCSPVRDNITCETARCESFEVNEGKAF